MAEDRFKDWTQASPSLILLLAMGRAGLIRADEGAALHWTNPNTELKFTGRGLMMCVDPLLPLVNLSIPTTPTVKGREPPRNKHAEAFTVWQK